MFGKMEPEPNPSIATARPNLQPRGRSGGGGRCESSVQAGEADEAAAKVVVAGAKVGRRGLELEELRS